MSEHVRIIKVKAKVSGCFRSKNSAGDYTKIMSFVGTAKKLGHDAFSAILLAFSGNPHMILKPES